MEDLDPQGRRAARENWAQMGMVKSRHGEALAAAQQAQATTTNPEYVKKMGHRISTLKAVEPHLEDKPMTERGAAAERVKYIEAGAKRAREHGPEEGGLGGADFYFDHHNLIREAGRATGFTPHEAITGTTSMSPLNAPTTERAAGRAAMKLVGEPGHTVEMTPELHKAATGVLKGTMKSMNPPPLPKETVGQTVKVEDLHHTHVAALGAVNAPMRKKGQPIQSSAPEAFTAMGATRLSPEIARSIGHLRGHIPEEDVIAPGGAPKVHTYKETTKAHVPNTPEHGEFGVRLHHYIHGDPKQHVMDLFGLRHSQKGVLSSDAPTVEDTWMNAISTRQVPTNIGGGGRGVSVAKTAGTDPKLAGADAMRKASPTSEATVADDPGITATGLVHALNSSASRMAAKKIKIQMGDETTNLPSVAGHAMAWTEIRRQADKDPEYKAAQEAKQDVAGRQFKAPRNQPKLGKERTATAVKQTPVPSSVRQPVGPAMKKQRRQRARAAKNAPASAPEAASAAAPYVPPSTPAGPVMTEFRRKRAAANG
jgi:hypothetical protein